jgi:hypothetical protein
MSRAALESISRHGLDDAFVADESRKSDLLLAAQLLRDQGQDRAAAARFANAAALEQGLADRCLAAGLAEKALVHRFSAASCWAQAGNFYQAIALCDALQVENNLPESLRERVSLYVDALRSRRAQWYRELMLRNEAVNS